jgi:hypothetical protein
MGAYGNNVPVAAIGYGEPGLAFYQGGGVLPPADDQYLQITPPADWPRWIVISSDDWKAVPADLKQLLRFRAEEKGLNYAHEGRIEDVLILEKITPGK